MPKHPTKTKRRRGRPRKGSPDSAGSSKASASTAVVGQGETPGHAADDSAAFLVPALLHQRQQRKFELTDADVELFKQAEAAHQSASEQAADSDRQDHRKLEEIVMGEYRIPVWHSSPYPQEYNAQKTIYICEFCLQYFKSEELLRRHMAKPFDVHPPHPPGDEIYRQGNYSFWEIDGQKEKVFCQNQCLLAKLFLNHKTLYYDVEPFLFYVLTKWDEYGAHIVGYFSKEKDSFLNYNVSCILTLPQYQRRGIGQFMIEFSYLLSRKEKKIGSPEKPLSDLGLVSYRRYWQNAILDYLDKHQDSSTFSVKAMSEETSITAHDIISTLQYMGMIKYWRGKHVVVPREDIMAKRRLRRGKAQLSVDASCLRWTPLPPSNK